MKRKRIGFYGAFAGLCAVLALQSCAKQCVYAPYVYGALNESAFVEEEKDGYVRLGAYSTLGCKDKTEIQPSLEGVYGLGFRRHVIPSVGERKLTVIAVDFADMPASKINGDVHGRLSEAFFGDGQGNQYVSLAEYYDRASFHRLHVQGHVANGVFRSSESYETLKAKTNASQTKAALTKIYGEAIAWYNALPDRTGDLISGDPIYFVYLAPYSGMSGEGSRSSMMWAFTINDPAPICWSSYYMMHPRDDGSVDTHTFIHEFGHMLGLKDYYDQNSYSDVSACSPMGRMDMMDCSLGEHNAFSKMLLGWNRPYIPAGEAEITLRPYSGNGDCVLLPVGEFNGNPYDEYLLLEYYTPTYLNYADASLRNDDGMSLMGTSGIRAYHVDARLGVYEDRAKSPVAAFDANTWLGTRSLDFYRDNSGQSSGSTAYSDRGFLIQNLNVHGGTLPSYYVASDRDEDTIYEDVRVKLRRSVFLEGEGIGADYANLFLHKSGAKLPYGFRVSSVTATEAKIQIVPLAD